MRKKIILLTLMSVMTLVFISCEKIDVPEGTPRCIKKRIKEETEKETNCLNEVQLYEYNGENVFVFLFDCPDLGLYILNEESETICSSFWGGGTTCPDFDSSATFKNTIWEK